MWWTTYGERTLEGAEAVLFAETLLNMLDEIRRSPFDSYYTGVEIFDRLTLGQKISVLSIVGNGLLRKDVPSIEIMEVVEGAIAAVFEHLINLIGVEIEDFESGFGWREKVIAARMATRGRDITESTCDDLEVWIIEVESLAEVILWDTYQDSEHLYLDYPMKNFKCLKRPTDISESYYSGAVDDLSEHDIDRKLKEIRDLCLLIIESS